MFTEAQNLKAVNGRVAGVKNATPEFERLLEIIRADEGEVWLRELGFSMNRAFTREQRVNDIGLPDVSQPSSATNAS